MMRPMALLLALILAFVPVGSGVAGIVHLQMITHQMADSVSDGHAGGEHQADQGTAGGCSAMPGHCIVSVILPEATHVRARPIAMARMSVSPYDRDEGVLLVNDPPPPRS